jgi:hypothetical protein
MLFCDRPETPVTILAGIRKPDTTRILQNVLHDEA